MFYLYLIVSTRCQMWTMRSVYKAHVKKADICQLAVTAIACCILYEIEAVYICLCSNLCLLHFTTTTDGIQEQNYANKIIFSLLTHHTTPKYCQRKMIDALRNTLE